MKTEIDYSEMTEGQLKAIALKQHQGDDFFIIHDDSDNDDWKTFIFEGDETEARSDFEADIEGTEEVNIEANFLIYCQNNLTEIPEIDGDEEVNGYIVLTDDEADEKAKECILDSVWAFNPSFLASETGIDVEVFEAIQNNNRCESNNQAILSMIDDEEEFVSSAISADGRGHFMSSYDGNENEETVGDTTFYIYRIN
jgi:hypothetical protein